MAQAPSSGSSSSSSDSLMAGGADSVSKGCGWGAGVWVHLCVCVVGAASEHLAQTNGELTLHPSHFLPSPRALETPRVRLLSWDPASSQ